MEMIALLLTNFLFVLDHRLTNSTVIVVVFGGLFNPGFKPEKSWKASGSGEKFPT